MKKRTRLCLIGAMLACFGGLVACNDGETSESKKNTGVQFIGVQELHLKVGETTADTLLKGVTVKLPNGTTVKPNLIAEDIDYTKAGDYAISYEYDGQKVNSVVFLYAMPQVYLNGTVVTEETVAFTYRQANESYNFIKGVAIKDSFGNELAMQTTDDSEKYDGVLGDYTVTYTATDKAGNALSQTITYQVTSSKMPEVTSFNYEVGGTTETPLNAYGEKTGWLYSDGLLVSSEYFTLKENSLKFEQKYLLSLGVGEHEFSFKTAEGFTEFSLTVTDTGKPIFEIPEVKTEYAYGELRLEYPVKLWSAHEDYTYEYELSGTNGYMLAEEQEQTQTRNANILLVTPYGDDLNAGDYTISVTATSANGEKTTTMQYDFTVTDKVTPTLTGGEKSSFTKTTFESEEAYLWDKQDGSEVWAGRLAFSVPASRYMAMTFDFFVAESSQKGTDDNKANILLRGVTSTLGYNYREIDHTEGVMDKQTKAYVAIDDIEVGKWYTAIFKLDKCVSNQSGYLYMGYNEEHLIGGKVYMKNITFHDKGNIDIKANGNSSFTPALLDESVYGESVVYKYINSGSSTWNGRVEASYTKTERMQIEYDIYIESSSKADGTKANANMQLVTASCNNMIHKNFGVVDRATGEYVNTADMELGKWYTVTATTYLSNFDTTLYWYFADVIEMTAYFTAIRFVNKLSDNEVQIMPEISPANANKTTKVAYKTANARTLATLGVENAIEYYKPASVSAWDGRLYFKTNGVNQTITFDLYIAESSLADGGKANVSTAGCDGTYYDKFSKIVEKGKTTAIAQADLQVGKWYTITYNLAGLAKDKTCYIYFDTSNKGLAVKAYFTEFQYA